jgi:GNAT superfamily N-acetyltransferase
MQVDHVRAEAANHTSEAKQPPGVCQAACPTDQVDACAGGPQVRDEVVLVRQRVGHVDLDVVAAFAGERHQQALRATRAEPLDDVEDPHDLTMARSAARYGARVSDLAIRPYEDVDEAAVLDLLAASLGKTVDDRYRGFFRWKHLENPFGRSYMWVGELEGRIVGFRSFLRWRFVDPGGEPVEAVRAVDTATHPDARGMGIFRTLTMHGLDEMRPAGVSFVFNTPNDQSRPGYLKMGWRVEGRVPVKVRPRSLPALWRMARARSAAEPWSLPADVGQPVESMTYLADLAPPAMRSGLATDRSAAFVGWRYAGCPAVSSRALPVGGEGAVVARFRTRGEAVECTVADVLGMADRRSAGSVLRRALRTAGADYAIAAGGTPVAGMVGASRLGPVHTRREVGEDAGTPLSLVLGDVELF